MRIVSVLAIVLAVLAFPGSANADEEWLQDRQLLVVEEACELRPVSPGQDPAFTSAVLCGSNTWNQVVVSWNADMPEGSGLKVELRAVYQDRTSAWYVMGLWSMDPKLNPRESVRGQRDQDGRVDTDTLILTQPARDFQVRLSSRAGQPAPHVRFLALSLARTGTEAPPQRPPNKAAWGKSLPVPERSQMPYPNGKELCSPATVSMLLGFWAAELREPKLDRAVPEVAAGVYDRQWPGTGNWSFNMAYAGSVAAMRAYVDRYADVRDLEDCIASGVPVGISVCYNRLRGKSGEPSGHLVVVAGFDPEGNVIVNDPGTSRGVRKVFPRANLVRAWSYSQNTVYRVHPANRN